MCGGPVPAFFIGLPVSFRLSPARIAKLPFRFLKNAIKLLSW